MNTDEAIKRISIRLGIAGLSDEERKAWLVIRAHVDRKVDDAMVERYAASYFNWWDKIPESSRVIYRKEIRDALIAALGVEG